MHVKGSSTIYIRADGSIDPLTANITTTDNIDIADYEWDFDDGNIGIGETIHHIYEKPGTYAVVLTIKDLAGNTDTKSINILVPSQSEDFLP